jgi:Co/Zn/Cd efflux system component
MGKSCCEAKATELEILRNKQGSVLKWVLLINAVMFVVEFAYGLLSHSSALMADSLDMLGDAAVYGFSLYALNRGARWRASAGLSKGIVMAMLGVGVLGQTLYRLSTGAVPMAETMGAVGFIALAANSICLFLLYKHRSDDINMKSTWICSRNDIISNVSVIGASFLVAASGSGIPDWVVGFIIAGLFLKSSVSVIREAKAELAAI